MLNPVMKRALVPVTVLLVVGSVCADEYRDSEVLGQRANAWTTGEAVPTGLLVYRNSYKEGSCFPDPAGTASIFYAITNYSLLKEIIFQPGLDPRIFTNAINEALVVVGPGRFFQDALDKFESRPELLKTKRFQDLKAQARVKHVVVDSLYITYADMPPEKIKETLGAIRQELNGGTPWDKVYKSWSDKMEYPYEEKLSDGTTLKGTRTKVGNLGDFILPKNRNKLFSYREEWMPKEHLSKLFSGRTGEVLILFDKEDLSRFAGLAEKETGERYVLYRIREIWSGIK
jgi:hypothetical protein